MMGYSIVGLADVFKKVADAVLENDDVTEIQFTAIEYEDFDQVGEFVASTLRGLKCDFEKEVLDDKENALCSDNVILVCPNCHREIHYGKDYRVEENETTIYIKLGTKEAVIRKNNLQYLITKT